MSNLDERQGSVIPNHTDILAGMYEAFNARDVDRVLKAMVSDVDWPNGWEGGRVVGRDAVREYWRRQWEVLDPTVTPVDYTPLPDGRLSVRVHQQVRDLAGSLLINTHVNHVYTFRGGLIQSMEIA